MGEASASPFLCLINNPMRLIVSIALLVACSASFAMEDVTESISIRRLYNGSTLVIENTMPYSISCLLGKNWYGIGKTPIKSPSPQKLQSLTGSSGYKIIHIEDNTVYHHYRGRYIGTIQCVRLDK